MTELDGEKQGTDVPERELDMFRRQVSAKAEYDDPNRVTEMYGALGLTVLPDLFDSRLVTRIIVAIREGAPLSVIRIGDGEGSVVAFRSYTGTPSLDRHVLKATVSIMKDSFSISELWMTVLRDLLLLAVRQADIVGVTGFSVGKQFGLTPRSEPRSERILHRLCKDIRGAVGSWRSTDIMIRFAKEGLLSGKTIAHAHLYFSILRNLDKLISNAPRVICINDSVEVSHAMRKKYPDSEFQHIMTGHAGNVKPADALTAPEFLHDVENQLPEDLQGCLCLVGAGIWSEIYCTWIRQRGGVGVDIGSGFDLLAGKATRPVHRGMLGNTGNRFALVT